MDRPDPLYGMHLDPLSSILSIIPLNFGDPNARLNFGGYRVSVGGGISRTAGNIFSFIGASEGSSRESLYQLTPALYHALLRLDPHNNPATRLTCLLAWRALYLLADGYKSRGLHHGSPMVYQFITSTLLRMITEAFAGRLSSPAEYGITNRAGDLVWTGSPLMNYSDSQWQAKDKMSMDFVGLHFELVQGLHGFGENKLDEGERHFAAIDAHLEVLAAKITYQAKIAGTTPAEPAPATNIVSFDVPTLRGQIQGYTMTWFQTSFWDWFRGIPNVNEAIWKSTGVPLEDSRRGEFLVWLGLQDASSSQASSSSSSQPVSAAGASYKPPAGSAPIPVGFHPLAGAMRAPASTPAGSWQAGDTGGDSWEPPQAYGSVPGSYYTNFTVGSPIDKGASIWGARSPTRPATSPLAIGNGRPFIVSGTDSTTSDQPAHSPDDD